MALTGIYKITNVVNGKFYIGSAVNYKKRCIEHKSGLSNNKHHSSKLQNSYNKHGEHNFIFELIEECDIEQLLIREQYNIDTLKPEYNISLVAGSPMLNRRHTEETIKKLSEAHKGKKLTEEHIKKLKGQTRTKETKRKMSESSKGNTHTEETKLKISLSHKGKFHTPETKRKIGEAHRGLKYKSKKEYGLCLPD